MILATKKALSLVGQHTTSLKSLPNKTTFPKEIQYYLLIYSRRQTEGQKKSGMILCPYFSFAKNAPRLVETIGVK